MFPNDAITESFAIGTAATLTVTDPGEYTVLNVSLWQNSNNSPVRVDCGTSNIFRSYKEGFMSSPLSYNCEDVINIVKGGNAGETAFVTVTYVPYLLDNVASSSVGYNPSDNIASSSDVKVYGAISAGELIITTLLIMALLLKMFELMARGLSGLEIKRRFLRYGGGDVPIDKE